MKKERVELAAVLDERDARMVVARQGHHPEGHHGHGADQPEAALRKHHLKSQEIGNWSHS